MISEMIIVATASHRAGRDWPFGYGSFDVTNSIQFDFNLNKYDGRLTEQMVWNQLKTKKASTRSSRTSYFRVIDKYQLSEWSLQHKE